MILKRLRDEFGKRTIQQVVSGQRAEIMDELRVAAKDQAGRARARDRGRAHQAGGPSRRREPVRVQPDARPSARKWPSGSAPRARRRRASFGRTRTRTARFIIAEADREAQITRGAGDARATEIYASAFGQDREFYKLYRSLNAYRTAFGSTSDILLLEPKSEFFDYFKGSEARP